MPKMTRFAIIALSIALAAGTLAAENPPQQPPATSAVADPTGHADSSSLPIRGGGSPASTGVPAVQASAPDTIGPYDAAGDAAVHPPFDRFLPAGPIEYGVANNQGVYVSLDGGKSWDLRSEGLPPREVYPFSRHAIETITSIGVDPRDPKRVAVTTSLGLYLSENAGENWRAVPLRDPISKVAYITAVALSPWSSTTYAVGTSFGGIFETTDGGRSWKSLEKGLEFLYRGAGFYEEIAGLAYSPIAKDILFLGVDFGGGVYRSSRDKSSWSTAHFPATTAASSAGGTAGGQIIEGLSTGLEKGRPVLVAATRSDYWQEELPGGGWKTVGRPSAPPPVGRAKAERVAEAAGLSGLYLAAYNASGNRLRRMIAFAKRNGLNSFVVDVKDDFGRLTYESKLPLARKLGAVHPYFDLEGLIKTAHANGIHVIGRMVVFKDEPLYRYDNFKYAIWDSKTGEPWGKKVKEVDGKTGAVRMVQKEFFVDPFSEDVWRYNVSIAEELQAMGIDEIQFDYIRFPSDGPLSEAHYRYRRAGMTRIDALESFMVMVRQAIHIPISTDLYGFNCWYRMGNWIGQNIEMLANYVDVICPMYYPSLFPEGFKEKVPYLERAREIYAEGTRRAKEIVRGRADIRPFVQAFLLLDNEVKMDRATYSKYLRVQLAGARAAGASGFTLWNAGNDYYMVTFPLQPYLPTSGADAKLLR